METTQRPDIVVQPRHGDELTCLVVEADAKGMVAGSMCMQSGAEPPAICGLLVDALQVLDELKQRNFLISMLPRARKASLTECKLSARDAYEKEEMNVELKNGVLSVTIPKTKTERYVINIERYMKLRAKRKLNAGKDDTLSENPKKIQRNTRNAKSKRTQKSVKSSGEAEYHTSSNRQSSSCDSSEDDSNSSLELNRGNTSSFSKGSAITPNLNGKTRASRGSATDPQSLYARKRRERINDRLRILQGLVPNGTKVDISRMLEDLNAVNPFRNTSTISFASNDNSSAAPLVIYETARAMTETQVCVSKFNMSWKFEVDPSFDYLVRLHFCDLFSETENQRVFRIYINNKTAAENYDVFHLKGWKNKAYHEEFVDTVPMHTDTLRVQLGYNPSANSDAILNGLKIVKLSQLQIQTQF